MMQPWNETGKRPYVLVVLDESSPKVRKPFHCHVCGQVCFEYYTRLRMVMAIKEENLDEVLREVSAPTLHACTRKVNSNGASRTCKTMYLVA